MQPFSVALNLDSSHEPDRLRVSVDFTDSDGTSIEPQHRRVNVDSDEYGLVLSLTPQEAIELARILTNAARSALTH